MVLLVKKEDCTPNFGLLLVDTNGLMVLLDKEELYVKFWYTIG